MTVFRQPDTEQEWLDSPERLEALTKFLDQGPSRTSGDDLDDVVTIRTGGLFRHSQIFANARLAFRRRLNDSPFSETT